MIQIQILGPQGAGKGNAIALIAKCLAEKGLTVHVQGAETHNKEKLARPIEQLVSRLRSETLVLTELQTGPGKGGVDG